MRRRMLPVALCLRNVSVRYGRRVAVCGLSLDVRRGEIVGLLGPNGSGKSSTLLAAAGVIDAAAGTVTIDGRTRKQSPAHYASQVGLVPQDPALYDELSAADNLAFFGKLYGLRDFGLDARIGRALVRARLSDRANCKVGSFSGGMKQRLSIACALLHDPAVLLLDEPTAALDPASRDTLFADLHALRDEGHAILLTTHHLDEAEHGCDRVVVLRDGVAEACGPPREVFRSAAGPVLYGHLKEPLPKYLEKQLANVLGPGVSFEVTGRRLRLAADTEANLGRALAAVLAEGATLTTFRTPPAVARQREAA
jgi:ABC-2 type transport system ATP-binding protein